MEERGREKERKRERGRLEERGTDTESKRKGQWLCIEVVVISNSTNTEVSG